MKHNPVLLTFALIVGLSVWFATPSMAQDQRPRPPLCGSVRACPGCCMSR